MQDTMIFSSHTPGRITVHNYDLAEEFSSSKPSCMFTLNYAATTIDIFTCIFIEK